MKCVKVLHKWGNRKRWWFYYRPKVFNPKLPKVWILTMWIKELDMKNEIHYEFFFPWEAPIHRPLLQPFEYVCRDHKTLVWYFMNLYPLWCFVLWFQPQVHQVIHLETSLHSMLICILLLFILGNLQVIFQNLQNILTLFNPILSLWISTITKNVDDKIWWIITIKFFKRIHANGHMESSIVTKLTQIQLFYPCFLLPTNIVPQVAFQPLIYPLCLTISLWMISCARFQIFPHDFEEFLSKCTQKCGIYVTNNPLGLPVQYKNLFK